MDAQTKTPELTAVGPGGVVPPALYGHTPDSAPKLDLVGDIRLTPAALHDDFRGFDHRQHTRTAHLFGLAWIGDVRPLQLGSE